jgi:tetratricopeptide (TPR) repeat protein
VGLPGSSRFLAAKVDQRERVESVCETSTGGTADACGVCHDPPYRRIVTEQPVIAGAASKMGRYAAQLGDRSIHISEIELHRIITDCKKVLRDPNEKESPAPQLQTLIGVAHTRLGKHQDALAWYRMAVGLERTVGTLTNLGCGLTNVGEVEGALDVWVEAIEQLGTTPGSDGVILFGNLAEGLMAFGSVQDSWAAFQEAIRRADLCSTFETFVLAHQAAELGADREAAEFFARHLAVKQGVALGNTDAVAFLRGISTDVVMRAFGDASDNMRGAILRAVGFLRLGELPLDRAVGLGNNETLAESFSATKPLRARANYFGLPEHAE